MKYTNMIDRFIEYVKIDTQSNPSSQTIPTTKNQLDLANLLVKQLKEMLLNPYMDEYGFVSVCLKGTLDVEAVGFLAHMDTASDYSGKNVKPQVIYNYDGSDIPMQDDVLSPKQFPSLLNYVGGTIITTDGTTLLGADDKAGIAMIMEMLDYFIQHPEIEHGDIYAAFTIDEEGGPGVTNFDLTHFKPKYAYTIDGGPAGEFNYETFNGTSLTMDIKGVSIHPGSAKNQMIHPHEIFNQFHNALPYYEKPEYTENREGFYLLIHVESGLEQLKAHYIIRDHDMHLFNCKKEYAAKVLEELKSKYPTAQINYQITDSYYNMKEKVLEVPQAIEYASKAIENQGLQLKVEAIRGGTDGSKLSFMGIPTPNLFTGGHNAHGKYEYVHVESMEKGTDVMVDIVKMIASNK